MPIHGNDLFNHRKLGYIIKNWNTISLPDECKRDWKVSNHITGATFEVNPLSTITKFYSLRKKVKSSKDIAFVDVSYHQSVSAEKNKYKKGRQYVKDAMGLQSFNHIIRNTICCDLYDDIDVVNCHSTILSQLCVKKGWSCEKIDYYNDNREECLKTMMELSGKTRKECKTDVIIAMYNNGRVAGYSGLKWFDDFKANIQYIQDEMAKDKEFEEELAFAIKKNKNKPIEKQNVLGSLCSLIMNQYENDILNQALLFIVSKGWSVDNVVRTFDGFMYNKGFFTEVALRELEEWIFNQTGWRIQYLIKPMTEKIELPDDLGDEVMNVEKPDVGDIYEGEDKIIIKDDSQGALMLIDKMKESILVSPISYYVKDGVKWSCDLKRFDTLLKIKCMEMNFCHKSQLTGIITAYSRNKRGCDNIVSVAKDYLFKNPDNQLEEMMFNSVANKICFPNGVFDFETMSFTPWEKNPDVYTTIVMPMDYVEKDDSIETLMVKLETKVFDSAFGSNVAQKVDFLSGLALAVSGNPNDKISFVGMGHRNSGKGTITECAVNTFGSYVETFDSGVFLKNGMEESRRLSFLLDKRYARVLISNEAPASANGSNKNTSVFDGILIKKTQGGDKLEARNIFERSSKFRIQGKIMMMCNDMPSFEPADCLDCVETYMFPYKFVDESSMTDENNLPFYRKADPSIKDFVKLPDVRIAFFHLLLKYYKKNRSVSAETKEVVKEVQKECGNEEQLFKNTFIRSQEETDYITSSSVLHWVKEQKLNMSSIKIKKLLTDMGFPYVNGKQIDGKRFTGFLYIKWREGHNDNVC